MSGVFLIEPGRCYQLGTDGPILQARQVDDDPGGVAFVGVDVSGIEFVLRESHHGDGRPCTALVARSRRHRSAALTERLGPAVSLGVTDFTLYDVREVTR